MTGLQPLRGLSLCAGSRGLQAPECPHSGCHPEHLDAHRRVTVKDEQAMLPPGGRREVSPGQAKRSPGLQCKESSSPVGAKGTVPILGCSSGAKVATATESKAWPEPAEGDLRLQFVAWKGHGFKACPWTAGPHACPLAEPGPKGPPLRRFLQGPPGP